MWILYGTWLVFYVILKSPTKWNTLGNESHDKEWNWLYDYEWYGILIYDFQMNSNWLYLWLSLLRIVISLCNIWVNFYSNHIWLKWNLNTKNIMNITRWFYKYNKKQENLPLNPWYIIYIFITCKRIKVF